MKIFFRLALVFLSLHFAVSVHAQCDGPPVLAPGPSVANINTTTATLGGIVTSDGDGASCEVVLTGIEWSTSPGGPYTTVNGTETGTGSFTVTVNGLPAATNIYFRAFAENDDETRSPGYSNELSFYTLANEPGAHAASLTATALSSSSILLEFPPASDITDADGYIILMEDDGTDPNTANLADGAPPNTANDFYAIVTSTAAQDYTATTGLSGGQQYRFAIIPFNREGNDGTYNYRTSAGFPITTATTQGDIEINSLTGGLAPTTLDNNFTNRALVGFAIDASGPATFQQVVIDISSPTAGKLTNFRLCASADNTFDGVGTDAVVGGTNFSITATNITITLSQSLTGVHRYFLVADVEPTATNTSPSVTFSYDEGDFTFTPNNISGTVSQSRTYSFNDVRAPEIVSIIPADNSTGVDFNINKFVLTFNENVDNINTAATTNNHRLLVYDASTNAVVITVNRNNILGNGTPTIEVPLPPGLLQPNKSYYVLVGGSVIEDTSPGNNNWGGISSNTAWTFTTSGVLVNNVSSAICGGSFQPIGDIIISEQAAGDFMTSGTVYLDFSNTNFGFDISSVSVSAGPAGNTDITSISINPKTLTRLTLNFTLDGNNDKIDVITISGLKVYASAAGSTTITAGNSVTGVWAINQPITFSSITVGASAPSAPTLETSDLKYCLNEDISSTTVTVENNGGTFTWYSNSSLSTPLATGHTVDVSDLNINTSVAGSTTRYVVRVDGCQSVPLPVTFEVAPVPVADAGPASLETCSGSSVTLGGAPTLAGPSVSGPYQYQWSTSSPAGFTDMGSNPTVTPISTTDVTVHYTVKIVDANGCASDILHPDATVAVHVKNTEEVIVYDSPLSTSFTLNSDPIELAATPSINSSYSGNGVYLSGGKYYFDPDLAGTDNSPHAITYTTQLTNGCTKTEVRDFAVSTSSGSIINVAGSYCASESADPLKVLSLGTDWQNNLDANNAIYLANYGYIYEFYDFQAYTQAGTVGPGVIGNVALGQPQYVQPNSADPNGLQPYVPGGNYTYIGMRVRQKTEDRLLGIPLGTYTYGSPLFWAVQYVNLYAIPDLKVGGIRPGQVICNIDETIELEANFNSGTFEISRDETNWISGPAAGLVESPVNSGKAILNPHHAYISTSFAAPHNNPASLITDFYIRYTYVVPNTSGSNNSACEGTLIIPIKISNNPVVTWSPLSDTEFCFEDPNITVSTVAPADPSQIDTFTGFGIFDHQNRTANFSPTEALAAKAFANNVPPYTNYSSPEDIVISATRTDVNGCKTTIAQTVRVRPQFPASFSESDLSVCYEDGTQDIIGDQPNGSFVLLHPNLTVPIAGNTINNFNLRTYFDQAVAQGADGSVMQTFNLTFNTSDPTPGLGCQNSVTKVFTVNPPIPMDIGGMTDEMIVCGNGQPFVLTGNQPGAGTFEISTQPTSGFIGNALGLNTTAPGTALYTPSVAAVPAGDPQKTLYIRYSFLGAGCNGAAQTIERLIINPQPDISFASSIPAANTQYCFEQGASPLTVNLSTNQSTNVLFTGYGITDEGSGSAIFNPTAAFQQSSLADNKNPLTDETQRHITIRAVRTDALGCSNERTRVYIVNPLPLANFNPVTQYCYEDLPVALSGSQPNVRYEVTYQNTTTPPNYNTGPIPGPTLNFDPSHYFDDAVSKGANGLATLQFSVVYTSISSTTGCTNTLAPVVLSVAPYLPGEMAGLEDGDIFCSNEKDREITFSPQNGIFRIDGNVRTVEQGKFVFDPPLALPDIPQNGRTYQFTYEVTTGNNCTNTQTKTIRVLPSPRALFSVVPQCDTALIAYDAVTSTNLPTATYNWNFSGEMVTGQNVEHRFPGVSTYYAKLKVEHPPYVVDPSNTLVCADSLQQDQIIGPYPKDLRFEYFNICEGDDTNFEVTSTVPINRVSWNFDDGEVTPLGILSENITGLPQTTGTYQQPVHRFSSAFDELNVTVQGRTSDNFGGCPATFSRKISILKRWSPTVDELRYDMSELENGKGFWVAEDREGNSTWDFATAAKQVIQSDDMTWITGAAQPYLADDISYVNSPCFDLSAFSRPVISLRHWTHTESSDGAVMQYSTDGGDTWERLGDVATGISWYNRVSIASNPGEQTATSSGWSALDQFEWFTGKHALDLPLAERQKIRFRIGFASFTNPENRDGFAFNNVVIEERNRTVLVENFTTLNPTEQSNNVEFFDFRADGTGAFNTAELVKLQYHHSPAQNPLPPDQLHLANPTDQNARAAFYGITNASRAFIDGGFGDLSALSNYLSPAIDLYYSLRTLVTSPVKVALDFDSEPNDQLNIRATIQATENLSAPEGYSIFIAVAEQSVNGQVYVLRKLLPSAAGTPLTSVSTTDGPQEIQVSYDMRHVTRFPDGSFAPFAVIAFVQNLHTKDVLQTVVRLDGTASPGVVTGIETQFEGNVRVYPNPADELMNIILPAPAQYAMPLKVYDTFGREVYSGSFETGQEAKTVATKQLSAGVYLIQLSTTSGVIQRKVMVVHD